MNLRSFVLLASLACAAGVQAELPALNPDAANPMTVVIHHSMEQRFSRLIKFYEPGVIGLGKDGMVALVGDPMRLKIGTRQIVEKLIDQENSDRLAFLASVAEANGRGTDLTEARAAWRLRWAKQMPTGGMLQDDHGEWQKKP